ncbi:DUF726 domain-containing protein [Nonlabens antarcticus]|uniref:DUF726 domain-containing protein n=1 Tax=Nonlabens antarcticus TaxID=392714 RepID=UPI001890F31B|nr:DUF726 domain-containing protein [Nonlabens antarcticus]
MRINCLSEYEKVLASLETKPNILNYFSSSSTDKFEIIKIKDGKFPAVITINGFLSQGTENSSNWKNSINHLYPENTWHHLEWDSQSIPLTKTERRSKRKYKNSNSWIKAFKVFNILVAPYTIIPILNQTALNNIWAIALRNSKKCGYLLSEILKATDDKNYILIGHSLGTRVIYHCLMHNIMSKYLQKVIELHLLGGAVGNNYEKWKFITQDFNVTVFNYFSKHDSILKHIYGRFMLNRSTIGLKPIISKKVINTDTSDIVKSHFHYIKNFHRIKKS